MTRADSYRSVKIVLVIITLTTFLLVKTYRVSVFKIQQSTNLENEVFSHTFEQIPNNSEVLIDENGIKLLNHESWFYFQYKTGKKFGVKSSDRIRDTIITLKTRSSDKIVKNLRIPVPVTAISSNHIHELKSHFKNILHFIESLSLDDRPSEILIYNLAPNSGNLKTSLSHFKKTTEHLNITLKIRDFEFKHYPSHVKDLHNYSWKILIQMEVLAEFGALWWFDASAKPNEDKFGLLEHSIKSSVKNGFCQTFLTNPSGFVPGIHTCKKMLDFLPIVGRDNLEFWERTGKMQQATSSIKILGGKNVNSHKILGNSENGDSYNVPTMNPSYSGCAINVHIPAFMCALHESCIAPYGSSQLICQKDEDKQPDDCESLCHRYDQSMDNLITGQFYNFSLEKYSIFARNGGIQVLELERTSELAGFLVENASWFLILLLAILVAGLYFWSTRFNKFSEN